MVEMEQNLRYLMECLLGLLARQTKEMKARQEEMKADINACAKACKAKAEVHLKQLYKDIKGHMEAFWKDESLPSIVSCLSREVESWLRRNGGQCGYLQRVFDQDVGHRSGGKSRSNGGHSGVAETP
jgi:5-methylcytosine-specific restriction endonuclease McrA